MDDQLYAMDGGPDGQHWSRTISDPDPFDMLSMDGLENPPWMFGTDEVTWAAPKRAAGVPTQPPPRPEEFDRVVRETMVENLTERVHLQKRVDVVHHGGKPEAGESCSVVLRAMWAMPLVFFAHGVKLASRPLVGCCSAGRAAPEKLQAVQEPDAAAAPVDAEAAAAPGSDVTAPEAVKAADAAEAPAESADAEGDPDTAAPADSGEVAAATAAEQAADSVEGVDQIPRAKAKGRRQPGMNASVLSVSQNVQSSAGALLGGFAAGGAKRGGGRGRGELASVIGGDAPAGPALLPAAKAAPPPPPADASAPANQSGGEAAGASAAAPARAAEAKRRQRPANMNASVLDASANVSSGAGALLGQYAMGGKRGSSGSRGGRGELASVIGGPAGGGAPAPAALPVRSGDGRMAKPAPPPDTSANNAAAPSAGGGSSSSSQAPENRARPKSQNRQRGADGKTVVTNVVSGSAASNLLGPMVNKAGKKRATGDLASTIG